MFGVDNCVGWRMARRGEVVFVVELSWLVAFTCFGCRPVKEQMKESRRVNQSLHSCSSLFVYICSRCEVIH